MIEISMRGVVRGGSLGAEMRLDGAVGKMGAGYDPEPFPVDQLRAYGLPGKGVTALPVLSQLWDLESSPDVDAVAA